MQSLPHKHGAIQLIIYQRQNFNLAVAAVNISPAVIRVYSQSFASAENVLLQRGTAHHPAAAAVLELWPAVGDALAQVHLMELKDACWPREGESTHLAASRRLLRETRGMGNEN